MRAIAVIMRGNNGIEHATHFQVTSACPKEALDIEALLKEHLNWCDDYYKSNKDSLSWFFIRAPYIPMLDDINWPGDPLNDGQAMKAAVYRACAIDDMPLKDAIIRALEDDSNTFGSDAHIIRGALDVGWEPNQDHMSTVEASLEDEGVHSQAETLIKSLRLQLKDDPVNAIPLGKACYVWEAREYIEDCRYQLESAQIRKEMSPASLIAEVRKLREQLCEDNRDPFIGSRIITLEMELRDRGFTFGFVKISDKS